ncbi:MAG: NAD(P)-binding domain-containing protein [Nitrososphaera sp.]|nr:NAD(P)-binding domain-containing protein [Nitrososphaera sp.]
MKVGILGSGDVGQRLGDGFIELGYTVMMGTRTPAKVHPWVSKHEMKKALSGSFSEAASFGELVVIATLWAGTAAAIKSAGAKKFAGKVVIDVTNPLDFSKSPPRLALGHDDSAGETVQRLIPDGKVVKAFNIVGNAHMLHPDFPGGPPTMFICGNDDAAKRTVEKILLSFGWDIVDIGGIEGSRLLEPLAMLWITYYVRTKSGDHAFRLLRK